MYNYIAVYEREFEDLKDRYSTEQIPLIIAKLEIDKLYEEVANAVSILPSLHEDELTNRLNALYKQICEFKEFIDELIELRHGTTL